MTMATYSGPAVLSAVSGLDEAEKATLTQLWKCWTQKMYRNMLRAAYYDQRNTLVDLGIAIPPDLTSVQMVLGWPSKAVDVLARRCKFEQFTTPRPDGDDFGVAELWRDNDMLVELPQIISSAFVHCCSFLMVTQGDTAAGEPEVLISSQSALYGAGLWDYRLRRLRAAFSVLDMDEMGRPTKFVMFLPRLTIHGYWDKRWEIRRYAHTLDRLPVEVLPYQPRLDRPFGRSRISRAVMGLSDSALRTLFRMEVGAEFFAAPQRWIMGADEAAFMDANGKPKTPWQAIIGRVWGVDRDDDGNVPVVGQFPATSPQPHTEQMRTLASLFCAETSLPLSALGIVHDNPASAEAIEAAERDLVIEARYAMDCFGPRLVRTVQTAVQVRDGLDELPSELAAMGVRWSAPENLPVSAAADAMSKVVASLPWLGESQIPLEMLDWDDSTIQRAMAGKRRADATLMTQLLSQVRTDGGIGRGAPVPAGPGERAGGNGTGQSVGAGQPSQ